MRQCSLIIGGTKGLGLELARESSLRGFRTLAVGRAAHLGSLSLGSWPIDFHRVEFIVGDLTRADALVQRLERELSDVTHLFMVAGNFSRKPFTELTWKEIDDLYDVHTRGPRKFLNAFHRLAMQAQPVSDMPRRSYHLVMISSTSSWRMRENEALYSEVQAAKAHFARQFSVELVRDLPGSKTTLVCPAGMATDFFKGTGVDTSEFMNPCVVAGLIWSQVQYQVSPFQEMHILRTREGEPIVNFGQKMPEAPNFGAPRPPKPEAPPVHFLQEGEMPPKPEPREVRVVEEGEVDPKKIDTSGFGC